MPRHFLYRKNCPLAWGDLDRPPSNTWFLGPTQILNPNVILTGSDTFAQLTAECPYTLQWAALCPSKLPIPTGISGPHLTHDSLGSPNHTVSGSFQPSLQGSLVWQTDRWTDHATRSVTLGCTYVCSTAMQPKNRSFDPVGQKTVKYSDSAINKNTNMCTISPDWTGDVHHYIQRYPPTSTLPAISSWPLVSWFPSVFFLHLFSKRTFGY